MDRLDLLSTFGELFPRLATVLVVLGLVLMPKIVTGEILSVGKEEGARLTAALESVIGHHRVRHGADGYHESAVAGPRRQ